MESCDSCKIITMTECPGEAAHCAEGMHCRGQYADCAADPEHTDKCDSCGAIVPSLRAED